MYELGVRSMFVCHKYDNALCGVRFDSGTQGAIVNIGNLLGTGRFWQARTCTTAEHDNTIEPAGVLPGQIARLLPPGISLPAYPAPPHCNTRGLTSLGEHMVQGVMRRGMLIEIDHMSVKAAGRALDLLEAAAYPGVVSSHSWTDQRYLDRIWALGGMVTQYGHDAGEFVAEWRRSAPIRQAHQVAGYGYGLDANGMGRLPGPRSGSAVTYPFTTFEGVTLDRQRTGDRVWDVNVGNRSGPGGDPVGDAERVLLVQDPRLPRPALAGGGHDLPGGPPGDQDALAGGGIQAQQHTGVGRPERGPDPGVDLDRGRVEVTGSLLITAGTAVGHDEQPHGPLTRAQLAPESPAAVG